MSFTDLTQSRRGRLPARPQGLRLDQRGFSLVEVAIAATVLGLVFVSTMFGLQAGFQMMETARKTTLASQIMQSEIENLRLKNWAQLEDLDAMATVAIDSSFSAVANAFSCVRVIEEERTNLKRVTLTVTWVSYDGISRSRSYTTYFAKNGLNDYYYRTL
jgi:prepilin-type N-terminal cleavage/methylation domain-containing protein